MTATELQAAVRKTLTSRAFERFIGLAVENALTEAARIEGAVQLPRLEKIRVEFDDLHSAIYIYSSIPGMDTRMYLRRPGEASHYKVQGWYVTEDRVDTRGRKWSTRYGPMVPDDFGNLVELPK